MTLHWFCSLCEYTSQLSTDWLSFCAGGHGGRPGQERLVDRGEGRTHRPLPLQLREHYLRAGHGESIAFPQYLCGTEYQVSRLSVTPQFLVEQTQRGSVEHRFVTVGSVGELQIAVFAVVIHSIVHVYCCLYRLYTSTAVVRGGQFSSRATILPDLATMSRARAVYSGLVAIREGGQSEIKRYSWGQEGVRLPGGNRELRDLFVGEIAA